MTARKPTQHSTPSQPENVNDLRQVLEDLDGVERLILMQMNLLKEMRRRIRTVETAVLKND